MFWFIHYTHLSVFKQTPNQLGARSARPAMSNENDTEKTGSKILNI